MRTLLRLLLAPSIALAISSLLPAQELTELQARSPEEFDDYLLVEAAATPRARTTQADRFLARWPRSALSTPVRIWKMEAHRELNEGEAALDAGRRAAEDSPNSVPALITVSELLVNLRTEPAELQRAAELARKVLALVDGGIDVPRTVPLERWLQSKAGFEARAWSAIGQAAFKQDRIAEALEAFQTAVAREPAFDAARRLRYGLLLRAAGRIADARRELELVIKEGPDALRERARAALKASSN